MLPLAIYAPSLNAPFIYDDYDNIAHNADVQNPSRLFKKMARKPGSQEYPFELIYWARPATFLTFAMTYQLSGLNPYGHRLFNVLVHAAATLLLFFLSASVFRMVEPEAGRLLPWLLALAFAAHPLCTDAVTFISNRSDAMATFFYLLALFLFIKMTGGRQRSLLWGAASAFSFVLAFASKEIAATFPLIVLRLVLDSGSAYYYFVSQFLFFTRLGAVRVFPRLS